MQASPIRVFVALLGVIAAIVAVVLITRPAAPTPAAPAPIESEDHSLTDAEAIARFKELSDLHTKAYREADRDLVDLIYTSDSLVRPTALDEIETLNERGVFSRTRFDTQAVEVVQNTVSQIKLLETVVVYPKFVDRRGRDVTKRGVVERQRVHWILRPESSRWLVYDTVIIASRKLGDA